MNDANRLVIILRNRQIDRYAQDFLGAPPGRGGGARRLRPRRALERVDNGQVEWYDLDFPHVIELHRRFVGDVRQRHHFLACSVLDNAWLDTLSVHRPRPSCFWPKASSCT